MSGDPTRLTTISAPPDTIRVKGFNNTSSSVVSTGFIADAKSEVYVPGMPDDLVLLCAADYTYRLRCYHNVLSLSPDQQQILRDYAQQHDVMKTLTVNNNTYEVVSPPHSHSYPIAYYSTATKYFNSKVNVSTALERILSTGLTFRDLLFFTNNDAVSGLPRELTVTALHSFEKKYGRTSSSHSPTYLATQSQSSRTVCNASKLISSNPSLTISQPAMQRPSHPVMLMVYWSIPWLYVNIQSM